MPESDCVELQLDDELRGQDPKPLDLLRTPNNKQPVLSFTLRLTHYLPHASIIATSVSTALTGLSHPHGFNKTS